MNIIVNLSDLWFIKGEYLDGLTYKINNFFVLSPMSLLRSPVEIRCFNQYLEKKEKHDLVLSQRHAALLSL